MAFIYLNKSRAIIKCCIIIYVRFHSPDEVEMASEGSMRHTVSQLFNIVLFHSPDGLQIFTENRRYLARWFMFHWIRQMTGRMRWYQKAIRELSGAKFSPLSAKCSKCYQLSKIDLDLQKVLNFCIHTYHCDVLKGDETFKIAVVPSQDERMNQVSDVCQAAERNKRLPWQQPVDETSNKNVKQFVMFIPSRKYTLSPHI